MVDVKPRVLWVSRHVPLAAQLKYLESRLGDYDIKVFANKVPSAEWLVENVVVPGGYRYVIAVLPLSIIARLAELQGRHGFTLLRADMELLHNDYSDKCSVFDWERDVMVPGVDAGGRRMWRHYRFKGFKKIKRIELVLEEW